ncbi:hypothetical protein I79_003317 [Cricetulus griseus]|uniref:Uncharacterized protein n=1 Tax=Cricetulus griseus TaxID=10029 RepID=G3GZM7_CRIGR|nr:hypothetical protein I79_003317 [Cricetulus griseus]
MDRERRAGITPSCRQHPLLLADLLSCGQGTPGGQPFEPEVPIPTLPEPPCLPRLSGLVNVSCSWFFQVQKLEIQTQQ